MAKISQVSKKTITSGFEVNLKKIRTGIVDLIKEEHPELNKNGYISLDELNYFRRLYLSKLIEQERKELNQIDKTVIEAIKNNALLNEDIQEEPSTNLTYGQKMADLIASFGGSWTFIFIFFAFILLWIFTNIIFLSNQAFDPYPFILLNLILSCLASIQAPIIMMSQNRQEQKDRIRSEKDFKINLKAELEIKLLSEKIDHLLLHHSLKLLEIQDLQTDYLEDLLIETSKNETRTQKTKTSHSS